MFGSVIKCQCANMQGDVAVKIIRNQEIYRTSGETELKILKELNEGDPYGKTKILKPFRQKEYYKSFGNLYSLKSSLHCYGIF